jgi:hypothetical protein
VTRPKRKDPQSAEEWSEAVCLADAWLRIHSAGQYGLITGGPAVDVSRAEEILETGRKRGIRPDEKRVDDIIQAFAEGPAQNPEGE